MLDGYWKINNQLEVAGSLKQKLRNSQWTTARHELGMRYKGSNDIAYSLKTDFKGNIMSGISWITNCNNILVVI